MSSKPLRASVSSFVALAWTPTGMVTRPSSASRHLLFRSVWRSRMVMPVSVPSGSISPLALQIRVAQPDGDAGERALGIHFATCRLAVFALQLAGCLVHGAGRQSAKVRE